MRKLGRGVWLTLCLVAGVAFYAGRWALIAAIPVAVVFAGAWIFSTV